MTSSTVITLAAGLLLLGCERREPPPPPPADSTVVTETGRWQELRVEVPKLSAFLESRIEFSAGQRASLSAQQAAALDAAHEAQASVKASWDQAEREFLAGNVSAAVAKGEASAERAREALRSLGIDPG